MAQQPAPGLGGLGSQPHLLPGETAKNLGGAVASGRLLLSEVCPPSIQWHVGAGAWGDEGVFLLLGRGGGWGTKPISGQETCGLAGTSPLTLRLLSAAASDGGRRPSVEAGPPLPFKCWADSEKGILGSSRLTKPIGVETATVVVV